MHTLGSMDLAAPPSDRASQRPLQWLVLLLVVLLVWVLRPVLGSLVLGGFAVLVAYRPYERLALALHGRRSLAALLATALLTVAVLLPLGLAVWFAIREAADGLRWLTHAVASSGGHLPLLDRLPASLRDRFDAPGGAVDAAISWAARNASAAPRLLRSTGWLLANALLAVVTIYYLFVEGPALVSFLRRVSPLREEQTQALLSEFRAVALALVRGNLLVALFQGVTAGIGYAIFGVSHLLLLALATAAASFVPLLGTGLVWLPLGLALALTGHVGRGVGLLVWCAALVALGDNLLRPLVSKGQMALPRLLVFLTLFGGLQMFGAKGLLLGPLLGSLAVTALRQLARRP